MRITASKGLLARKFRHGDVFVNEGVWTDVDPSQKKVRETLLAYVPSHITVARGQERELAEAGLELRDNRLIDLRAAELAAAAEKTKRDAKAPRAEK